MAADFHEVKKRKTGAWTGPLALVVLAAVALLLMSLFFRVKDIRVVNASDYSAEQIIKSSGLEIGENLFFVNRFTAAARIFSAMPYAEDVTIQRDGRTLVIQITGSAPSAWIKNGSEYWLINRKGKLLEQVNEYGTGSLIELKGITLYSPAENSEAAADSPERLTYALALLNALQGEGMDKVVSVVDFTTVENPVLKYDKRLTVYLGSNDGDVPRRISLMKNAVRKLSADDIGTLRYSGNDTWAFSPD